MIPIPVSNLKPIALVVALTSLVGATYYYADSKGYERGFDVRNEEVSLLRDDLNVMTSRALVAETAKSTCEGSIDELQMMVNQNAMEHANRISALQRGQARSLAVSARLQESLAAGSKNECSAARSVAETYFNELQENQE